MALLNTRANSYLNRGTKILNKLLKRKKASTVPLR